MKYHHKLRRQLQSAQLDAKQLEQLAPFLKMVDDSYRLFDFDMQHAESILEESSKELFLRNQQLKNNVKEVKGQLNKVASNIKDVIFEIDLNGNWSYLNNAWEELTGQPVNETLGKPVGECLKNTKGKPFLNLINLESPETNTFSKTLESLDRNGKKIWLKFTINCIKSDSGTIDGYIGTIANITNLKRTELQLIKSREKEIKANKAKGEFLSTMSHEIRTPLNAVIGIAHLLLIEDPKQEQIENLETLKYSSEHLLGVVNDILDYDKIASGSLHLEEANFSLKQVLTTVESIFSNIASKKGISFKIEKDALLQDSMIGDSTRLSQVLTNLVSNAIKFTEKGQVNLKIKVVEESEDDSKLSFTVIDTGIGIPDDKIEKIFESFAQANPSTTRLYGGTGLGLAICQKLLELMGTSLKVESTFGTGSSFSFDVKLKKGNPIASLFEDELHEKDTPDQSSLFGRRFLVVDDNRINLLVVEKFLKKWGVGFDIATNGKIAVEKAATNEYDLILMDLQMPVMDGYNASLAIRKSDRPYTRKVPIFALSASTSTAIKTDLLKFGINGLITKPFNPDELFAILSETLNKKIEIDLD
ncbi:MAG: hypothetical protein CML05_08850 [Pseudozobellia sp.]|nr:hypothetical protein [Pseudozobellia sp.]|tara:strand:+ start:720807 stop:722573 length:1767 start_codon:yes stop_codon:yes gene_type:complete